LFAYFIGNIFAKKYQNPFMYVKVIASERWDVFLRHGVQPILAAFNVTIRLLSRVVQWFLPETDCALLATAIDSRCINQRVRRRQFPVLVALVRPEVPVVDSRLTCAAAGA